MSAGDKALRIHDRALDSISRVETLVGLMESVGQYSHSPPVDPVVIVGTAAMTGAEMEQVRAALDAMRKLVSSG